jgi:cell division protein FtsW (lipid II flippase)
MPDNPFSGGNFGSLRDAIIYIVVTGAALFIVLYIPYAWYWRVAIFVVTMFVIRLIYPTIQRAYDWLIKQRT